MNLVRYTPHRRAATQSNSNFFNGMLDEFFTPFAMVNQQAGRSEVSLKVDIYEKDGLIVIDAELPGIDKEDISIDIKGKHLTVGGERKATTEATAENSYRRERRYGKFERTFNLPFDVDGDNVTASFTNGVLKLEIAKPEEQEAKKITIN